MQMIKKYVDTILVAPVAVWREGKEYLSTESDQSNPYSFIEIITVNEFVNLL